MASQAGEFQEPTVGGDAYPNTQASSQGAGYDAGSQLTGNEGSQLAGDSQFSNQYGSQYSAQGSSQFIGPEGSQDGYGRGGGQQYLGDEASQYPSTQGSQYMGPKGDGDYGDPAHPQVMVQPSNDEPEEVVGGLLDSVISDAHPGKAAAKSVLGEVMKDVEAEAEQNALQKKFGKQYKEPGKPTDLQICDKYFIKPGRFGVSSPDGLFPGTGESPPNASLSEFQFPEDDKDKDDNLGSFLELIDKCSVEFPDKGDDEESESDMEVDAYDSEYIKNTVGIPLTLALAEIVAKKPTDPLHFLGHWLYKWRYNQEAKQAEVEKINALILEREALKEAERERQRLLDEKMALQLIDNIMDDVMDASRKKRDDEFFGEEESPGDEGWYGNQYGGEGWYPPQDYTQYPQQSDQFPPGSSPGSPGYEQFPPRNPDQPQQY